jgi:hypothetical protein
MSDCPVPFRGSAGLLMFGTWQTAYDSLLGLLDAFFGCVALPIAANLN